MANKFNTQYFGTPVGANRYGLVIWYDNEPVLVTYAIETWWEFDQDDKPVNRGRYRNCKVSEPVNAQTYARYGAEEIDSLPMYESGKDIPEDFFVEIF